MNKELLYENRNKILFTCLFLAAVLLASVGLQLFVHLRKDENDRAAQEVLNSLTYTESKAESELNSLLRFTEKALLSDHARGKLYQSMAEISYMSGDGMEYNSYVGHAMFYLGLTDDATSIVYLYNKYIGRLYANGCYAAASELLDELGQRCEIDQLSPEAEAALSLTGEEKNTALHRAKLDLLTARLYLLQGDYDAARSQIAGYHSDDTLGFEADNVYVICDFRIPYFEIMTKLLLHNGNTEAACSFADQYIAYCNNYNFRAMKLRLLQAIAGETSFTDEDGLDPYRLMEKEVSAQTLTEMTDEYGFFLLSDIERTEEELSSILNTRTVQINIAIAGTIAVCVGIVLFCFISLLVDFMSKDALTRLNGRKKHERMRTLCERKKVPYALLVLDIDNFKKVNDTYGHKRGDEVLQNIVRILHRFTERSISAYRYGGEELCMIFLRQNAAQAAGIAEKIRLAIEKEAGGENLQVTVSGGIGNSLHGEDVFQAADRCLYRAKDEGKNRIC